MLGPSTLRWVGRHLDIGERILATDVLHGGIAAEMRKLTIGGSDGTTRYLVLRSYIAVCNVEDSLTRESRGLMTLRNTEVSAPQLIAVDATACHCEYPSLLMTFLPGRTILDDDGLETLIPLLARQLAEIHSLDLDDRPGEYRTRSTADTVIIPPRATLDIWSAAIDVIRKPAPPYEGRIVHRDFQPGNVLFSADPVRITGVVDWEGMSWGPADLDVAHCSTNLALLHGPDWGLRFAAAYEEAGGTLAATEDERRYWRVRDALACSEEVQLWAQPWREAGRADLTRRVVEDRLGTYVSALVDA